jgi:hypothetical protein
MSSTSAAAPKSKAKKGKKAKTATATSGAPAAATAGAGAAAPAKSAIETKVADAKTSMTIHDIDEKTKNLVKSDSSAAGSALGFLELKEEAKVSVPNVTSKLSEKEQAKLQAQIGNLQKVGGVFVVSLLSASCVFGCDSLPLRSQTNETKETKTFETKVRETDLKNVPTMYFKSCTDCVYHVNQRTVKILIGKADSAALILEEPLR